MPLENIREKKVFIDLDKTREIRFDLNALAELEEVYGDFNAALNALKKMSVKALRALLYAGLKHEDDKLTLKQVGSFVKTTDLKKIADKITEAFNAGMPDKKDMEEMQSINTPKMIPGPAVKNE